MCIRDSYGGQYCCVHDTQPAKQYRPRVLQHHTHHPEPDVPRWVYHHQYYSSPHYNNFGVLELQHTSASSTVVVTCYPIAPIGASNGGALILYPRIDIRGAPAYDIDVYAILADNCMYLTNTNN
eukprot:TRINITY_DN41225_c0_g1_i1.p1 TRINITY_DN41225_c0_g1~~TRINITY_DN41225_c0_g1_i1.p1  ORF type:complete len:124 (+),score=6.89 TRINITY_DN41225_c0_g1_i1:120-491(+)